MDQEPHPCIDVLPAEIVPDILGVHLLHGAAVFPGHLDLPLPQFQARPHLEQVGAESGKPAAPAALPEEFQGIHNKTGDNFVPVGRQLRRNLTGGEPLVAQAAGLNHQQALAHRQMQGVHRIDPLQFAGRHAGVLIGGGTGGTDVNVDHLIAVSHQGGEEVRKLLGGDGGGLGQQILAVVDVVDIVGGDIHAIFIGVIPLVDGQRDHPHLVAVQQVRRHVADAVRGDDDILFHGNLLNLPGRECLSPPRVGMVRLGICHRQLPLAPIIMATFRKMMRSNGPYFSIIRGKSKVENGGKGGALVKNRGCSGKNGFNILFTCFSRACAGSFNMAFL